MRFCLHRDWNYWRLIGHCSPRTHAKLSSKWLEFNFAPERNQPGYWGSTADGERDTDCRSPAFYIRGLVKKVSYKFRIAEGLCTTLAQGRECRCAIAKGRACLGRFTAQVGGQESGIETVSCANRIHRSDSLCGDVPALVSLLYQRPVEAAFADGYATRFAAVSSRQSSDGCSASGFPVMRQASSSLGRKISMMPSSSPSG